MNDDAPHEAFCLCCASASVTGLSCHGDRDVHVYEPKRLRRLEELRQERSNFCLNLEGAERASVSVCNERIAAVPNQIAKNEQPIGFGASLAIAVDVEHEPVAVGELRAGRLSMPDRSIKRPRPK